MTLSNVVIFVAFMRQDARSGRTHAENETSSRLAPAGLVSPRDPPAPVLAGRRWLVLTVCGGGRAPKMWFEIQPAHRANARVEHAAKPLSEC